MVEIRTSGKHSHRRVTIEDATTALGATSMTKGVLAACDHASRDVRNKQQALEYLETHVSGQHARKVAELLDTPHVPTRYQATVKVGVERVEGTDE